jgi:ABC-type polysaccharide/polyol phosphate transport system ATPase subunit
MSTIIFRGVTKSFSRRGRQMLLRSVLTQLRERQNEQRLTALRDISFELHDGDSVAIVGRNGAGKSTLLSLVAGLSRPDSGTITVEGRLAALLDLGAGFHPDLTGRENLFINSALFGLNRREVYERYDRIVDFSGLGEFINQPLRTYSSGMIMRLAFSVAVHVDPEIILIDEVLAVGDANFQEKCIQEIERLKHSGSLFICVSHGTAVLRQLCKKAIWLEHGALVQKGDINEVLMAYDARRQELENL